MDRPDRKDDRLDPDLDCPVCNARAKALVGAAQEVRKARYKCRKCDEEYWDNQAVGMQNRSIDSLEDEV